MNRQAQHFYEFGPFRLDPEERVLLREGRPVPLTPKAVEILLLLVEKAGHLVDKNEVMKRVWPDTFVEEGNLTKNIFFVRRVLGEWDSGQEYIETVPTRGYRFRASVKEVGNGDAATLGMQLPAAGSRPALLLRRWVWVLAAGLALAAGAYLGYRRFAARVSVPPGPIRLVVLPFQNLSGDPQQEYFSDGMTEALITELGRFNPLRVISRTSAMHYKGTNKTLPEIARELNVDAIVEGSAERSGDRVRITARLIEAARDRHLWAGSYERDFRDVLVLQDQVAWSIAHEVQAKLLRQTGPEQAPVARALTVNPEAYELYLQGRYFWNKRTAKALETAINYFQRAIQRDPEYAPAYMGLADCYGVLPNYTNLPSKEADQKAGAAATKALEIDPNLSEAYATLASSGPNRWNWLEAEKRFKRALELSPNYAIDASVVR